MAISKKYFELFYKFIFIYQIIIMLTYQFSPLLKISIKKHLRKIDFSINSKDILKTKIKN
jgi:hypothetical protein